VIARTKAQSGRRPTRQNDWFCAIAHGPSTWSQWAKRASNIAVPTAVVVTTRDEIVRTRRQYALAKAIPGAKLFEVDGNHFACADRRCDFVPKLVEACDYVDFAASANPAVSALAQGSRGQ